MAGTLQSAQLSPLLIVPEETPPRKRSWAAVEGSAVPQGVTWIAAERAYNFALYSKHAERVTLLLFGEDTATPLLSHELEYRNHKTGRIWHCRLRERLVQGARYYAYSIAGPPPEGRFAWHHFDPDKVLLDPYAPAVYFPAAFDRGAAIRPRSNLGRAPLGVLREPTCVFDWGNDRPPRHEAGLIIYELHVRGFTEHPNSQLPEEHRGTFLGVIDKIPYLQELGVDAVELMPIFQFDPQEGNYWGYMPMSFFAPHAGYATVAARLSGSECDEFSTMVKALHAADIEVILDVVYNHTAEGDQAGPTYSFRGIDNSTFYLMTGDPAHPYADFSGTGNTLHTANHYVRKMILDSLRYWVEEMHVDGFRFDLASIFTRKSDGSISLEEANILADIASDPHLAGIRLIAEPWDFAGTYQLGRALPGFAWMQWNDRFRDDVRRFLRGDSAHVGAAMRRLYGSDDVFPDDRANAYHPWQSVNYITCHDGFTLYDLVSYTHKRNWANGLGNSDGPSENFSWNCGWEGDEGVLEHVLQLRRRQVKNYYALLLLANGTPMLLAGDEFLQTQGGNNNPFNQDNPTTWLDWSKLTKNGEIFRFVKQMIAFRKAHPSIARSRFWRDDVQWFGSDGPADFSPESRSFAFYLRGAAQEDTDIYVMINAGAEDRPFRIQVPGGGWLRAVDTALAAPEDIAGAGAETHVSSTTYKVKGRSVVVLVHG